MVKSYAQKIGDHTLKPKYFQYSAEISLQSWPMAYLVICLFLLCQKYILFKIITKLIGRLNTEVHNLNE